MDKPGLPPTSVQYFIGHGMESHFAYREADLVKHGQAMFAYAIERAAMAVQGFEIDRRRYIAQGPAYIQSGCVQAIRALLKDGS